MGTSKKKHKDSDERRKKKSKKDEKANGDEKQRDESSGHEKKKKKRKRGHRESEPEAKETSKEPRIDKEQPEVSVNKRSRDDDDDGKETEEVVNEVEESTNEEEAVVKGGGDMSLSVEETNRLRAQIGLKPLDVDDKEKPAGDSKKKQDVHVPAHNIGKKKKEVELKRKLEEMKERRKIRDKLSKVKTLGEANDHENETAVDWIEKSRRIQEERTMATKREQMLREMDENVENEDEKATKERPPVYSTRDLAGLTVEHSKEAFVEGRSVVLTLKDAHVLDEEDQDVLYNVNLLDSEKAEKNVELKKGKPDYNPYGDNEVDEFGVLKEKIVLEKYDEEIEGDQPKSFQLGVHGGVTAEEVEEERQIRARLSIKGESLQYRKDQVASEYYSQEEMVQFKKPKKKRRVVRKALKAEDLLPLEEINRDHGSRQTLSDGNVDMKTNVRIKQEKIEMEGIVAEGAADDVSDMEEDEAEADLHKALQRARRVQASVKIGGVERVGEMLSKTTEMQSKQKVEQAEGQGKIVLSSIAEFCRTVGEKSEDLPERRISEAEEKHSESEEDMEFETADDQAEQSDNDEEKRVFEAEPSIGASITAALQMAVKKGMLNSGETERKFDKKMEFVDRDKAKNFFIESSSEPAVRGESEDPRRERERERDRDRDRRDRYDASHSQSSKDSYKPKVELKYINEKGETMDSKEAFRFLSHKFHGKKPGKSKTEKRVKKKLDDEALKKMHSTDTPLNTVAMMHEKQKQAGSAFLVLSGGARSLAGVPDFRRK